MQPREFMAPAILVTLVARASTWTSAVNPGDARADTGKIPHGRDEALLRRRGDPPCTPYFLDSGIFCPAAALGGLKAAIARHE